jgi:hypothetical protein
MRRLTVAVLVRTSVVAARKPPAKRTDMEKARDVSEGRAWKNQDAASDAIIADDFHSF